MEISVHDAFASLLGISPRPWRVGDPVDGSFPLLTADGDRLGMLIQEADAHFIARAPDMVFDLCKLAEQLRQQLRECLKPVGTGFFHRERSCR